MTGARAAPLVALSVIVAAAHWAALGQAPKWFAPHPSAPTSNVAMFTVRAVDSAAPAPGAQPAKDELKAPRMNVPERRAAAKPRVAVQPPDAPVAQASGASADAEPLPEAAEFSSGVRSGLVALAAASPPPPGGASGATLPAAFHVMGSRRMHYRVQLHKSLFAMTGKGELAFNHDGKHYEATLEVDVPVV